MRGIKIRNRQELSYYIDKTGIETNIIKSDNNRSIYETIVFIEETEFFYKVTWGNVLFEGEYYLWYEDSMSPVIFEDGSWMTKDEFYKYRESLTMYEFDTKLNEMISERVTLSIKKDASLNSWREELKIVFNKILMGDEVVIMTSENKDEIMNELVKAGSGRHYERFIAGKASTLDMLKVEEAFKVARATNLTFVSLDGWGYNLSRGLSKNKIDYLLLGKLFLNTSEGNMNNEDEMIKFHEELDEVAKNNDFEVLTIIKKE